MLKAYYEKYRLHFKQPAGTSRGILTYKDIYLLYVYDDTNPGKKGTGECSPLKGLSIDDRPEYETQLNKICRNIHFYATQINNQNNELINYPSIRFGLETALISLKSNDKDILFPSKFTEGKESIKINGLIWMGDYGFMKKQITRKIESGYSCIKIKIGAIDFDKELQLIRYIRKEFTEKDIEIRVDANGAFDTGTALEKLKRLSEYNLHSIEQPVKQGQWEETAKLCERSPVPVALDEELIGLNTYEKKEKLLTTVKPQYIILKPSLTGGFNSSEEWIKLAGHYETGWWITSALESNTGLNAIAQWTFILNNKMPQGLGTGQLFTNNFTSKLYITKGELRFNPD